MFDRLEQRERKKIKRGAYFLRDRKKSDASSYLTFYSVSFCCARMKFVCVHPLALK